MATVRLNCHRRIPKLIVALVLDYVANPRKVHSFGRLGMPSFGKRGGDGQLAKRELAGVTTADPYERALIDQHQPTEQRILTVGLLIFSLAFCALVFEAGLRKEVAVFEKCGLDGVASCQTIVANPQP